MSIRILLTAILATSALLISTESVPHPASADTGRGDLASGNGLVSVFGAEGDRFAPIAYVDGSYLLRDRSKALVNFGFTPPSGKVSWVNLDGYLPALQSTFDSGSMHVSILNFADVLTIGSNRFEVAYSRVTTTNTTSEACPLPAVSSGLIPLNDAARESTPLQPGETRTRDFAIAADRFTGKYAWPSAAQLVEAGTLESHLDHMRSYWNARLAPLATITALPDPRLINAMKAGFIDTMIVRDDIAGVRELHVGENGYDELFDHDTIGIVATLLTMGDFSYAKDYLDSLPAQLQYDDAQWKFSWPFALYLAETGDEAFVRSRFERIKTETHHIHTDRADSGTGIMKPSNAIDSLGSWTVDNWSALTGLTTYRYIAERLGETAEASWAASEYASLLAAATTRIQRTIDDNNLDYIPISMTGSNESGPRSDPRDANWASMFLFGRWAWDGYLFGAEQSGPMLTLIDDTYAHGIARRAQVSDSPFNFGGFPGAWYSSAYNAGYGSAGLRGDRYRDIGIHAYQFMLDHTQSGPFSWWESSDPPNAASLWDISHAPGGNGSSPHIWGQSTATKVLLNSLLSLRSDGTVIVARGVPNDWLAAGQHIAVTQFPVLNGGRIGVDISSTGSIVTVQLSGDLDRVPSVSFEAAGLIDNIAAVSGAGVTFDAASGVVRVPSGITTFTVTLTHPLSASAVQELAEPSAER